MPNPMEILDTGVVIGGGASTGTQANPVFDCNAPANFTNTATFVSGVTGVNKIRIGDTDYEIQIANTPAEGFLTFIL